MNNSAHIPQPMADRDGMSASRVSRHAAAWRGWTIAGLLIALAGAATVTFVARRALAPSWWPARAAVADLVAAVGTERIIEPREDSREQGPAHWAEFDRERARLTPNTMIFKTRKR